jgi:hypothetical protein
MSLRRILFTLGLSILALAQAGSAVALTYTPTVEVGRETGITWDMLDPLNASSTLNEAGGVATWTLTAPFVKSAYTVSAWTAELKEDPYVTNDITLKNTFGADAVFTVTVLLPIPAFAYNSVINSSVGVTVTDSNGNGTLLFDVSGATIYTGYVENPATTTLLPMNPITPGTIPISTADCPVTFPGCTATSSNGVASLGVASGTATAIGITLKFMLSDGDTAGITSRFEIANVAPEPATAALLGAGLAAIALARRRTA